MRNETTPLSLYETMLVIRRMEMRLSTLFAAGEIPGFIHLSVGQEAIAAGVASALRPGDTFATTHRGHGHAIANGVDLGRFALELLGRETGLCRGRSGSMHVADLSIGMLGANGIVGAGVPIALGSALAHRARGAGSVAVAFFGDGALAEGVIHESLNLAKLWSLSVLFVCENNGWSEFSPTERMLATSVGQLATAFGIPSQTVDGNDVGAVATAAFAAVGSMQATPGPRILECLTQRHRGHFEGDPQRYRSPAELASLSERDPVEVSRIALLAAGLSDSTLAELEQRVDARITAAIEQARLGPQPAIAAAAAGVYAEVQCG